ncbi:helix-turn-helix transcriptional regulator [Bacillus sp. FJAT-27445]|uniref:ArsR/SmtB family transcription factor n=1 Tax=Bacillus sp. FJAT-27445 TaxID=1679166 RepID=UPI000743C4EF|nr:ArsR family transcriptional regulator [Bacillus sp. FJAT-27445]
MKNKLNIEIKFLFHKPAELITAMYTIANWEQFENQRMELKMPRNEEVYKVYVQIKERLSRFLIQELEFFFKLESVTYPLFFMEYLYLQPTIATIPQLLEHIHEESSETLLHSMMGIIEDRETRSRLVQTLKETNDPTNYQIIIEELIQIRESTGSSNLDTMIECFQYPKEAAQRFYILVSRFYESAYVPIEKHLEEIAFNAIPKYEELYHEDPDHFFEEYIVSDISSFTKATWIHVSPFSQYRIYTSFMNNKLSPNWIVLGSILDQAIQYREELERVEQFFKVFSDKRRLEIIRKLFERPWYGQELAQDLKLTPAAINYHMNFLFDLKIITSKKVDHRIYYLLHPEKLERLFDLARRKIFPSSSSPSSMDEVLHPD